MKTIKALIVDDEPLARKIIQSHLAKVPNWTVVASCVNAEEAYEALLKFEVDVLFLDIQMPVITGIDFLKSLKHPPLVIFTTAYNEYALKGYELNVVDYLLKPIIFNRFYQAIEKAQERLTHSKKTEELEFNNTYFFFKYNGKLLKIVFADILYAKAEQEYSYIYTKDDKFLVSIHLKKLQEILPHEEFLRIHRSYIVAKSKIISIAGNSVQVLESITLPIAKNKKSELLNSLNIRNSTK
ncbi:MAG: response regulator transcription factor [Saprospiraceae bacterium]|nr:response regulator transcription factor [Saprospiraceae bacterium]